MKRSESDCGKCLGKKYLWVEGIWVPCDCANALRLKLKLRQLGVEAEVFAQALPPKLFKRAVRAFIRPETRVLFLSGGISLIRWGIAASFLTKSLAKSKTVYSIKINDLIDYYFSDQAEKIKRLVFTADLLWLRMDFVRKHSYLKSIVEEIITERQFKKTVVTAPSYTKLSDSQATFLVEKEYGSCGSDFKKNARRP